MVDVSFPVYVVAKDCGEVMAFPSHRAMQGFMEPIDVENDEYEAWDSNGNLLRLSVTKTRSVWLKVIKTETQVSAQEFAELRGRAKMQVVRESPLTAILRKAGLAKS